LPPQKESANYASARSNRDASRGRPSDNNCYECNKPLKDLEHGHIKASCKTFLATENGKSWTKTSSGRRVLGLWEARFGKKEMKKEKADIAIEMREASDDKTDTESIMSGYMVSTYSKDKTRKTAIFIY
jgi:hypothetical protein